MVGKIIIFKSFSVVKNNVIKPAMLGFLSIFLLCYIFLFICLLLVVPVIAYNSGGKLAEKEKSEYQGCESIDNLSTNKCLYIIKDNTLKAKGFLIAISDSYIALYDNNKSFIYQNDANEIVIVGEKDN